MARRAQAKQKDRPLFVLHDGPPYANGHLHCGAPVSLHARFVRMSTDKDLDTGHALNKITKDLINRSKLIQGYRVQCVPPHPASYPLRSRPIDPSRNQLRPRL